jgi:hypothetical protein
MPTPDGTSDYDGRALAFSFTSEGRTYRVLIEDITLDEDEETFSNPGTDEPSCRYGFGD